MLGPDILSPINTTTGRNDPTAAALLRSGVRLGMASRKVGSRQLTPAEYSAYQGEAGVRIKRALDAIVAGPTWRMMDDEGRQDAVEKIAKDQRKAVRAGMFGNAGARAAAVPFWMNDPVAR